MSAISLNAADVRNAQRFVSEDESRPLLQGIAIESTGVIAATNGHALLAITPEYGLDNRPHRDVLLSFPKKIPAWAVTLTLTVAETEGEHTYVVQCWNGRGKLESIVATEVLGPYSNWRQVMPRDEQVSTRYPMPMVNGEYVARFAACSEQGRVRFAPQENTERAVLVRMTDQRYIGLLMPLRQEDQFPVVVPAAIARRIEPREIEAVAARAA